MEARRGVHYPQRTPIKASKQEAGRPALCDVSNKKANLRVPTPRKCPPGSSLSQKLSPHGARGVGTYPPKKAIGLYPPPQKSLKRLVPKEMPISTDKSDSSRSLMIERKKQQLGTIAYPAVEENDPFIAPQVIPASSVGRPLKPRELLNLRREERRRQRLLQSHAANQAQYQGECTEDSHTKEDTGLGSQLLITATSLLAENATHPELHCEVSAVPSPIPNSAQQGHHPNEHAHSHVSAHLPREVQEEVVPVSTLKEDASDEKEATEPCSPWQPGGCHRMSQPTTAFKSTLPQASVSSEEDNCGQTELCNPSSPADPTTQLTDVQVPPQPLPSEVDEEVVPVSTPEEDASDEKEPTEPCSPWQPGGCHRMSQPTTAFKFALPQASVSSEEDNCGQTELCNPSSPADPNTQLTGAQVPPQPLPSEAQESQADVPSSSAPAPEPCCQSPQPSGPLPMEMVEPCIQESPQESRRKSKKRKLTQDGEEVHKEGRWTRRMEREQIRKARQPDVEYWVHEQSMLLSESQLPPVPHS